MAKKLYIKTYGCQMNVYDSARMADVLAPVGYEPTETPDDADLVILNTCHIREKAAEKVYSELGRLRALKRTRQAAGGSDMMVAVAGCVAQAEGAEMMRRAPVVDIVLGPQTYHRLPDMIARAEAAHERRQHAGVVETDFPVEPKFDFLPESAERRGASAFLTIQEGCDKFCTFCVVPYTRGAEFSRPLVGVLREARALAARGVRELTLLGQNVNAYHGAGPGDAGAGLGGLVRQLAEIDGIERIRYTTSHPRDVDDELVAAHRDVAQLMPYLHLPVQSGSDRILAAMNRRHTADHYRRTVDRLRAARPDLAFSSDFIVGFPGETDSDFEATLALAESVGFAQAYTFKYSPRPGTPAADLADQVPDALMSERLERLHALIGAQQLAFNRASVGGVQPVLLDRRGRSPGQLAGRGPYMQSIHVEAPESLFGEIVPIRIVAAEPHGLAGVLSGAGPEPARAESASV